MKRKDTTQTAIALACALGVATVGCGTDLTAAGRRVRVGKAPPHPKCEELGIVHGSGGGGMYTTSEDKMEGAQNELRNQAAEKGGNFVVMDVAGSDMSGMTISGRAFSCRHLEEQPAPAAPQPAKAPSAEERLRKLRDLMDKGLITQDEYERRKKEILESL
jgi:hypothetical protein